MVAAQDFSPFTRPEVAPNWVDGRVSQTTHGRRLEKRSPADGTVLCQVTRSDGVDLEAAISAAERAQPSWGAMPAVQRGMLLHDLAMALRARREEMAELVALETGKSHREALGETDAAIAQGLFMAGEGQRLFGRTTSAVPNRHIQIVRKPIGIAGLIIAANTPIANVAWKVFPALVCGNSVVLKAAEDTPPTAWLFAEISAEAGIPPGVLNVVQGLGAEVGAALVAHPKVGVISFTGSTAVGRQIAAVAGERLARVSLELGGKNPLVVCDDADLDNAEQWALLSAFSNAGQRCAAGSRIIVFDAVYEAFRERLIAATQQLRVGPSDDDDLGPVINERQLNNMLAAIETAEGHGASVLVGGKRLDDAAHGDGFYLAPTLIENVAPDDELSKIELFGPVATLYRVPDFNAALALANQSPYGLTAAIHTRDLNRATEFCHHVKAGVAVVNAGTYGSEPHLPFGGFKDSGNGSREPGPEALDVYSELRNISITSNPDRI